MSELYPPERELWCARDEEGLVYNDSITYADLSTGLYLSRQNQFVPWSDEAGTRLDLIFLLGGEQHGELQSGMDTDSYLWVAIVGGFANGFNLFGDRVRGGDIERKLAVDNPHTARKLAELINGVSSELVSKASDL